MLYNERVGIPSRKKYLIGLKHCFIAMKLHFRAPFVKYSLGSDCIYSGFLLIKNISKKLGNYHCNYMHGNLRTKYRQKEYLYSHLQKKIKCFLQCWKRLYKRPAAKPILLINALLKVIFQKAVVVLSLLLPKRSFKAQ